MQGVAGTATTGTGRRWLAAGASAFLASAVPGQPPEPPTFADVVDVTLVDLEVVVTDGGERVEGLSAEDFELSIDGEAVPIDHFTEVREGVAVAGGGPAPMAAAAPGEPVGTRFLVFVDDFFSIPTRRDLALAALAGDLVRLGPEDRMAVVAFDGRRIDLLAGWTRSRDELGAALEKAMGRTAYGLRRMSEIRRLGAHGSAASGFGGTMPGRSSFSSIGFLGAGRGVRPAELEPGPEVGGRISQVMRAAAATLRGFAGPPERKVMLLYSGCWQAFAVDRTDRLADFRRRGGPLGAVAGEGFHVFKPLVDTANRLGYTLYPVDLDPDAGAAARLASAGRDPVADGRDALFLVADATGGRAIEGPASDRALARAVEDTRSYYWLAFTPRWRGDGESHRLEVRTRRRGLRVRGRSELTDVDRTSEVELLVEGAQLFDRPLPGDGVIAAELGEVTRAGRGRIRVPLTLRIPLDKITLMPRGGSLAAALELRVAARDEDGQLADVPLVPVEIRRSAPPAAGEEEIFEVELRLRRKPHRLIVTLYDPLTAGLFSERLELEL
jgi:VWFA-related protein